MIFGLSLADVASDVIALCALLVAWLTWRQSNDERRRSGFVQQSDVFASPESRARRGQIYRLSERRLDFENWTPEERRAADHWIVDIDLAITMFWEDLVSRKIFWQIYGDSMIRTLYILIPYINHRVSGPTGVSPQLMLTSRKALPFLADYWLRLAKRGDFPGTITVSRETGETVDPLSLLDEEHVAIFLAQDDVRAKWRDLGSARSTGRFGYTLRALLRR